MVEAQDWRLHELFGLVRVDLARAGVLGLCVLGRTFPEGFVQPSCDRPVPESRPRNANRSLGLVLVFLSIWHIVPGCIKRRRTLKVCSSFISFQGTVA